MNSFNLKILSAERRFFQGDCESLVVPVPSGKYGILAGHCKTVTAVAEGELMYRVPGGKDKIIYVSDGMLKTDGHSCEILVDWAENIEDLEANRIKREQLFAEEEALVKKSMGEYDMAEVTIKRMLNKNEGHLSDEQHF